MLRDCRGPGGGAVPPRPARPAPRPVSRDRTAVAGGEHRPAPAGPRQHAGDRGRQLIDRIVAIVNKDVITQRDLNERVTLVASQLRARTRRCRKRTYSSGRCSSA